MSKKKANTKSIEVEMRAARSCEKECGEAYTQACNRVYELEEKYTALIEPEFVEILRSLEWMWPGKRGRREIKFFKMPKEHRIYELVKPLLKDGDRSIRLRLPESSADVYVRPDYSSWRDDNLYVCVNMKELQKLGIKKPGAEKNAWREVRKKLEEHGVTDPDEIAKILEQAKKKAK